MTKQSSNYLMTDVIRIAVINTSLHDLQSGHQKSLLLWWGKVTRLDLVRRDKAWESCRSPEKDLMLFQL
ncbi:hypothetical protein PQ465_20775 [Sphingobacterium oryzagri]|uniref:Uncharacterized protein n=1 Tax=Sphingobacterium oryzagri TaxID=3025669 RepID=A0ABY7WGI3_9SPHI|nr:hypothetical protein [Sphingobacterium sp. KACC 22765]WDF68716.1 hypothetical protein PQ465_20775 [Sphingobacterium sp. KACC 22765]